MKLFCLSIKNRSLITVCNDISDHESDLPTVYYCNIISYRYVSEILITATDQQIEELFSNLEKDNQELRSKYVDPPPDELLKNRRKRMIERLEYWISSLTTEQKQAVTDWSLRLQPISEEWLHSLNDLAQDFDQLGCEPEAKS